MKGKSQKTGEEDSEKAQICVVSSEVMPQRQCEVRARRDRSSVDTFH